MRGEAGPNGRGVFVDRRRGVGLACRFRGIRRDIILFQGVESGPPITDLKFITSKKMRAGHLHIAMREIPEEGCQITLRRAGCNRLTRRSISVCGLVTSTPA